MNSRRGIGAVVLTTIALVGLTIIVVSRPSTAGASGNLLSNGTFGGIAPDPGSLSGWKGGSAMLTLALDGEGGAGDAAKVAFSGTGASFNIHAAPRPVTSTVAGTFYTADGSFRSDISPAKKVCLKLTEYSSAGATLATARRCRLATASWASLPTVTMTTTQSGGSLGYSVTQPSAAGGDSFEVDNLSLQTGGSPDPVIATAGDIACDPSNSSFNGGNGTPGACRELATSNLILSDPAVTAVLALGDNQYECGGYQAYLQSYDPSWGRLLAMTHPVPGNHEYQTSGGTDCSTGAAGYFHYFGSAAGDTNGDYAWDIGAWHMIALNGNCGAVGGCDSASPQGTWLRNNLGSSTCTLAYWHQPYYTGTSTRASSYQYFWQTLYNAGADLVLNGHQHSYARFAPQDASGNLDATNGIRQFIAGTGGEGLFGLPGTKNVQITKNTFGVLTLTLHPTSYDWQFLNTSGNVLDSGTTPCH
jgi:acid phosphatase type 7